MDAGPARLLLESAENGWWYAAPGPDGCIVVVFVTDAAFMRVSGLSPAELWQRELQGTVHVRARVQDFVLAGAPQVVASGSSFIDPVGGRGWLAVGDAAATFDPLAAAGIHMALSDAVELGCIADREELTPDRVLLGFAEGRKNTYRRYVKELGAYYAAEARWPHSRYWERRRLAAGLESKPGGGV
jgi:2-polyprenyl-6-methoxyphenol hydroxylase-like FAD-dependent oxidoreductase